MRCAASLALLAVAHATLSPPRRERQGLSDGDQAPRTPTPRNPLEGAYQDYHGARQTPRSEPRGAEAGAGGEWRNIMGASDFNNLCAALDNTHFTDDQRPRLYRSFCRLFGNEDGARLRFGDGDDDAEEPGAVADDDFGAYIDSNERAAWAGEEDDAEEPTRAPTLAPCDDVLVLPTSAAHEATGA